MLSDLAQFRLVSRLAGAGEGATSTLLKILYDALQAQSDLNEQRRRALVKHAVTVCAMHGCVRVLNGRVLKEFWASTGGESMFEAALAAATETGEATAAKFLWEHRPEGVDAKVRGVARDLCGVFG